MLKFGSSTGRKETEEVKVKDGELICSGKIFSYIRSIDKTLRIEDDFPTCSIGVVLPDYTTDSTDIVLAPIEVQVRLRERARPKLKARSEYDLGQILSLTANGEAPTKLACDVKVEATEITLTCRFYGDGETYPTPEQILKATTSDGVKLVDLLGFDPSSLVESLSIVSKTIEKPIDNFLEATIEYAGRIGYPTDELRNAYIEPIEKALGISIDRSTSTVDINLVMRNEDNPRKTISVNIYGLTNIE